MGKEMLELLAKTKLKKKCDYCRKEKEEVMRVYYGSGFLCQSCNDKINRAWDNYYGS